MKNIIIRFRYLFCIGLILGCFSDVGSDSASYVITEPYSKEPFIDNFDGTAVDSSVWQVASWVEESITSPARCYVQGGNLNLIFKYEGGQFLGAAIQTRKEFLYGKWEARLKPSSVPGILNSMFTIDWDNTTTPGSGSDGTKQEIDIEFLTKSFTASNGEVHFAVHASGKTSFNLNPDKILGFNPSDGFHIWAIEITPAFIKWYVDDVLLYTYNYSSSGVSINGPYQLKFNVWTQNGGWVGGPPAADTVCVYQIDWVKFTPY